MWQHLPQVADRLFASFAWVGSWQPILVLDYQGSMGNMSIGRLLSGDKMAV